MVPIWNFTLFYANPGTKIAQDQPYLTADQEVKVTNVINLMFANLPSTDISSKRDHYVTKSV